MLESVLDNWPLKALSLGIAIILWFYVLGAEDPQTTQAVTVPVVTVREPSDLATISVTPQTVELRLRGRESALEHLQAGRIRLEANLRDAKVGENEVALRVVGVPQTLTTLYGYPTTATVELDKIIRRARPVHAIRRGEPASGFVIESIDPDHEEVTVIGATSVVRRVARVVVVVDASGLNSTMEFEAEVEARDHRDVVVNGVSFDPARVKVAISLRQVRVKWVPVRAVVGSPPPGWRVAAVTTSPPGVTVTGERGLDGVGSVSTVAVNISGLRGSKTYTVPLNVPAELSVLGAASVEVTVTTRSATSGAGAEPPDGGSEPPAPDEEPEEDIDEQPGNQEEGPAEGVQPDDGGLDTSEGGGSDEPPAPEEDETVTTPEPERPGP